MRDGVVECVTRRGVESVCLCFMRGFHAMARRGWGVDGAHLVGGDERARIVIVARQLSRARVDGIRKLDCVLT